MSSDPEIERRPSLESAGLVATAGGVATAASVAGGTGGVVAAAVGTAALVAGVRLATHRLADFGSLGVLAGVTISAVGGAPATMVVLGLVASVVAWDAGDNAISIGRQLGSEGATTRAETLHALAGSAVGVVAGGIGLVLFRVGPGGQPVATLFVLLIAAALLVLALNR